MSWCSSVTSRGGSRPNVVLAPRSGQWSITEIATEPSPFGDRPPNGHLASDLGIEELTELGVGLRSQRVEDLGEEPSCCRGKGDIDDLGIAETLVSELLDVGSG